MGITYKAAGVDIEAGDELVRRIKPHVKSTFNKNVLADIGLFGGFYEADFGGLNQPVLVSSVDGVGTKLKIAFMTGKHDTVGQCLVNHCVNDILCCGARPLFFLDYFATGKLDPEIAEKVIGGFAVACRENGAALIGGETAEMPSIYTNGEYDMSGTIVGVVDKSKVIDGKNISAGDILIGLESNGLHTNGYSLARNVLFPKHKHDEFIDALGKTIGDALLQIHRSYLHIVTPMLDLGILKGISHITGGGIIGNTSRIIPKHLGLNIEWDAWQMPELFRLIQNAGEIEDEEMRHVFNLGIGIILVADKSNVDKVMEMTSRFNPVVMGEVVTL
jgi:phosphoribosylformylglycinamidine cyclo-ligase